MGKSPDEDVLRYLDRIPARGIGRLTVRPLDVNAGRLCVELKNSINIAEYQRFFQKQSDVCMPVEAAGDVLEAKRMGKLGVGFHFQGTHPVGRNVDLAVACYKLGIRHMLLAVEYRGHLGLAG